MMGRSGTVAVANLCLIRHGQGSLGSSDYDRLSERGQRQCRHLAERIRAEYGDKWPAWSGTLRRQRQTLALLGPTAEEIADQALNEYTVSQLIKAAMDQADGLGIARPTAEALADPVAYLNQFLAWFPAVLAAWQTEALQCDHNGRWTHFHRRVLSPVPDWQLMLNSGRSPVVVSSAGVISTIAAELLGEDLAWQRELNIAMYNAAVTELRLDNQGRWQAVRINCIEHLPSKQLKTLA